MDVRYFSRNYSYTPCENPLDSKKSSAFPWSYCKVLGKQDELFTSETLLQEQFRESSEIHGISHYEILLLK